MILDYVEISMLLLTQTKSAVLDAICISNKKENSEKKQVELFDVHIIICSFFISK